MKAFVLILKSFVKGIFWIYFSVSLVWMFIIKKEYRNFLKIYNYIGLISIFLMLCFLIVPLPFLFCSVLIFYLITGLIASIYTRKLWGRSFFILPGEKEVIIVCPTFFKID